MELQLEAKYLLSRNRLARGFYLSAIAREEFAKAVILSRAWSFGEDLNLWRSFWKRFRAHRTKLRLDMLLQPEMGIQDLTDPKEVRYMMQFLPVLHQQLKEVALYVEYDKNEPTNPTAIIPPNLAKTFVGQTTKLLKLNQHMFKSESKIKYALQQQLEMFERLGYTRPVSSESLLSVFSREVLDEWKKALASSREEKPMKKRRKTDQYLDSMLRSIQVALDASSLKGREAVPKKPS